MTIAFVWSFNKAKEVYPNWRDGLRSAIELIGKEHEVDWYIGEIPTKEYDFMLFWDDSNSEMFNHLVGKKNGIILTTDPHNIDNLRKLDVVYCESNPIYEAVRAQGIHAVKAFGTDTDFFTPDDKVKKDIEYFYPATFSPWKKQRDLAYLGNQLYCVGTIQPDGVRDYESVVFTGAIVEVGYFPPEHIRDLYRRAHNVFIPAIHGSERTCLEAMSMNILPQVNPDNKRTYSYVEEFFRSGEKSPRDFVVKKYSADKYAKDIMKGIL